MSRARLPRCADCGVMDCRVVGITDYGNHGRIVRHVWLCGSGEYLRFKPNAPRAAPMPRERRAASLQQETLF